MKWTPILPAVPVGLTARGPTFSPGTGPANGTTNLQLGMTSDSALGRRRQRRAWPAMVRSLVAIIATATLALLAAACGGSPGSHVARLGSSTTQSSPSSTGSGGSRSAGGPANPQLGSSQEALAFSQCMRAHGVPKFPDPSSSNDTSSGFPKVAPQELGVTSSQFRAAENACKQLLPSGGEPTQSEKTLSRLLNFARCMRSLGVTSWPDPIPVSTQAPPGAPPYTFDLNGLPGLDARSFSPQVTAAMTQCFRLTRLTDSEVPWSG